MTNSREIILEKINQSNKNRIDNSESKFSFSDIYINNNESLELTFAQEFTKVNGRFVFCENLYDFKSNINLLLKEYNWDSVHTSEEDIKILLETASVAYESSNNNIFSINASVTTCEFLIARTGSIMVSSESSPKRLLNICSDVHIVIAYTNQIVYDIDEALSLIRTKYNIFPTHTCLITGPSRTADIEKTLVMGAHGPKELFVFLIKSEDYE